MMAVTEVNDCRYCSYFHIQVSLRAGLRKDEIQRVLSGAFEGAPKEELAALYFAQHCAHSGRNSQQPASTSGAVPASKSSSIWLVWFSGVEVKKTWMEGKSAENLASNWLASPGN